MAKRANLLLYISTQVLQKNNRVENNNNNNSNNNNNNNYLGVSRPQMRRSRSVLLSVPAYPSSAQRLMKMQNLT